MGRTDWASCMVICFAVCKSRWMWVGAVLWRKSSLTLLLGEVVWVASECDWLGWGLAQHLQQLAGLADSPAAVWIRWPEMAQALSLQWFTKAWASATSRLTPLTHLAQQCVIACSDSSLLELWRQFDYRGQIIPREIITWKCVRKLNKNLGSEQ